MNDENNIELKIRKATIYDNMEEIAELIYSTDEYIYPYWFETLEKCLEYEKRFDYNALIEECINNIEVISNLNPKKFDDLL